MRNTFHEVKIECIDDNNPKYAKVSIDGRDIRCTGYSVHHELGEVPKVTIDVLSMPSFNHEARVRLCSLRDLAKILSEDDFTLLCDLWHSYHNTAGE